MQKKKYPDGRLGGCRVDRVHHTPRAFHHRGRVSSGGEATGGGGEGGAGE